MLGHYQVDIYVVCVEVWVEQIVPHRLDMGIVLGIQGFGQLHSEG